MKKSKTKSLFMVLLMVLICNAQFMSTYDYIYTPYFTSRYSPRVWYYIPYADTNSMFSFQQPTFNIPSFVSTPSMSSSGISQQLSTSRSSEVQAILDRANGITPSSSITSGLTNFQSNSIPINTASTSTTEQQQVTRTLNLVDSILSRGNTVPANQGSSQSISNNPISTTSTSSPQRPTSTQQTSTSSVSDQVQAILNRANQLPTRDIPQITQTTPSVSTTPQPTTTTTTTQTTITQPNSNTQTGSSSSIQQILNRANQVPARDPQTTQTPISTPNTQQTTNSQTNTSPNQIQQILNRANQIPGRDTTQTTTTGQVSSTTQQILDSNKSPTTTSSTNRIQQILNQANSVPTRNTGSTQSNTNSAPSVSTPATTATTTSDTSNTPTVADRVKQILDRSNQVPARSTTDTTSNTQDVQAIIQNAKKQANPDIAVASANGQRASSTESATQPTTTTKPADTTAVDRIKQILNQANQIPASQNFQIDKTGTVTPAPAQTQTQTPAATNPPATQNTQTVKTATVADRVKDILDRANQIPNRDSSQTQTQSTTTTPANTPATPTPTPTADPAKTTQPASQPQPDPLLDRIKQLLNKANEVPVRQTPQPQPQPEVPATSTPTPDPITQPKIVVSSPSTTTTSTITAQVQPTSSVSDRVKQILDKANQLPAREPVPTPISNNPSSTDNQQGTSVPAGQSTTTPQASTQPQALPPATNEALDRIKQLLNNANQIPTRQSGPEAPPQPVAPPTTQTTSADKSTANQAVQQPTQATPTADTIKNQPVSNQIQSSVVDIQKVVAPVTSAPNDKFSQPAPTITSIISTDKTIQTTSEISTPTASIKSVEQMIQQILARANKIPTRETPIVDIAPGTSQSSASSSMQTQTQNLDGTITTKTVTSQKSSENGNPVIKNQDVVSQSTAPQGSQPNLTKPILDKVNVEPMLLESIPNLLPADIALPTPNLRSADVPATSG